MRKLIIIAVVFAALGCSKEEIEIDQVKTKVVNYYAYSEKGEFTFKYIDKDSEWHTVEVNQNEYTLTIDQIEENFGYITQLTATSPDYVLIRAECEGKKVEESYRATTTGGTISVGVELTELK